ncbi:MAG: hypothetical protein EOP04_20225 [Proteobacteria bacterium]|nr:MAG: hypothetical protein EOP04_20225 [Pseudomonadota bacterium]
MKTILFTIPGLMLLAALAQAECPDLSGMYASPTDTADTSTTFIVTQNKCDWISVTSTIFNPGSTTTGAGLNWTGRALRIA